jgi:hypothetical protein
MIQDSDLPTLAKKRFHQMGADDLAKSLKAFYSVIPANPSSGPGQAPESRVSP